MTNQKRRERARKLRLVVGKLEKAFGRRRRRRRPECMESTLFAIVADGVAEARAEPVFQRLCDEIVDWNELRVTRSREIEVMLAGVPEAGLKAEVIRNFLSKVFMSTHKMSGEFMQQWSGTRAKEFLLGVGSMTDSMRARALLKGFEMDVLPVTAEIVRVMKRVGVLESHLNQEKAHAFLLEILAPKRTYAFFHLVNELGEKACHARGPLCQECPVRGSCDKFRIAGGKSVGSDD